MKILKELLKKVEIVSIEGNDNIEIEFVEIDSRKVCKKTLFVAIRGTKTDGHNYINQSIEKEACAVICEEIPENKIEGVTYVKVKNSGETLGIIASNFYDNPSYKLRLVGITGTNGKTTTATLLYNLFRKMGFHVGLLSTIKICIDEHEHKATHTTPDALTLNKMLSEMVNRGCHFCFMEVSSHAIHQNRIAGLHFAAGIFTNLTHDHLDYHHSFKEYLEAKKKFFDQLPASAFALINVDDKNGKVMLQNTKANKYTYGVKTYANFKCKVLESHFDGMLFDFNGLEIWTKFIGGFNAYNILAVLGSAILLGEPQDEVLTLISKLNPVDGRFETIYSENGITAIVDYAHTPDALQNVIDTINEIKKRKQHLITVVGTGGDRDKTKRPIMAKIAAENSDKTILTSDNPRTEKPELILEDMKKGVEPKLLKRVLSIVNRKEAIKTACMLANSGDIILIAGKGHETYQEINGVRNHFDDREVVREFLQNAENNKK